MSEKGGLALVGHTVKDMEQLAGVAQVLRDPRIETLRLFLVDAEGKILAQTAVTSRLPGHSWIWPRGMTEIRWMNRLERQMERLGATGYYVLHNHPSGDPLPSMADVQVTRAYAERLPGLLGHVVINDVAYGLIETPKRDSTTGRLIKPTPYIVPLRPEDVVRVERGRAAQGFEAPEDVPGSITSPQELAAYGKVVQRRLDRGLTVVYADSAGRALWVAEFRAEAALRGKEFEDQLLGLARSVGGFQAVAVVRRPSPEIESALVEAMQHGCFRDVWVEGTAADPNDAYSFQQRNVRPFAQAVYGRNIRAIQEGTRSVQEPGPEEREGQAFFLRRRRLADEASARLFDEEIVADLKARHEADVERQRAARAEAEAEGGEPRGAPRGVRFTGPLPGGKAPTEAMEQGTLRRVAGKLKDEGVALGRFLAVTIPQGEFVFPS
ncbi:MAG TPA: JAB domain-containing protein, partial [Thermoanaerobaculaceae bacterium]|nr:JAB domain-containing protein [Thermoanaerobaculaceae bacterium]